MKFEPKINYLTEYTVNENTDDIWVVGDVHGCGEEFYEMCNWIKSKNPEARIFQIGDLIDRGPHLFEIFETIDKFGVELCVGNHELNFIFEHNGLKKCNSDARKKTHKIFSKLNKSQQDFVLECMLGASNCVKINFTQFEDIIWYLSHSPINGAESGYLNGDRIPVSATNFCMRNTPYNDEELYPNDFYAHGHQHWNYEPIEDQSEKICMLEKNSINVDGGCVYGGELVAYNICSNAVHTVKAKETYFKHGFTTK